MTDLWGSNVGNFSYHSLQITLLQRTAHGLNFNINYTYSKNIGDDGTFRSGFYIPSAALSGGGQNWQQDRIDRSWTTTSVPRDAACVRSLEPSIRQRQLGREFLGRTEPCRRLATVRNLYL